jgi:nucleotide-binding universal stress UspA family protein
LSASPQSSPGSQPAADSVSRIAVGVDGFPEGLDAAALGHAIASATGADLLLVAVHPDPLVPLPSGMDWSGLERQTEKIVREARDSLAPEARTAVVTDISVARALWRVVRREHRDLLVMGPSRSADEGHIRIGKRTRQLLCGFDCAVAVAPRGLHRREPLRFRRVGVGYDGGPESKAALALAGEIAIAAGGQLRVCAAVDDRIRSVGWSRIATGPAVIPGVGWSATGSTATPEWDQVVKATETSLLGDVEAAARVTGATAVAEVVRGRPANALLRLTEDVDLLVVGSRRWGMFARLVLGSTGEALLHDAACPVLVVPRPPD